MRAMQSVEILGSKGSIRGGPWELGVFHRGCTCGCEGASKWEYLIITQGRTTLPNGIDTRVLLCLAREARNHDRKSVAVLLVRDDRKQITPVRNATMAHGLLKQLSAMDQVQHEAPGGHNVH